MKFFARGIFSFVLFFVGVASAEYVDLIAFSYNRPLQLYAHLESIEKNVTGLNVAFVIYRADDEEYAQAYEEVWERFPWAQSLQQGEDPRADFKPLTLECFEATDCPYIMFSVDDDIVTRAIDCADCIHWLEQAGAYGFYLKLGLHLTDCYSENRKQPLPAFERIANDVYRWRFSSGQCDWGYPNTVDMTIYRKKDIESFFKSAHYTSPNILEGNWASRANKNLKGVCYAAARMVNIPVNRVQQTWRNRNMGSHTPAELLRLFQRGKKIDIEPLQGMKNPSVHTECELVFVECDK